jgi:hypothetical protein
MLAFRHAGAFHYPAGIRNDRDSPESTVNPLNIWRIGKYFGICVGANLFTNCKVNFDTTHLPFTH